jgi:trans-aconitate methyltransferase
VRLGPRLWRDVGVARAVLVANVKHTYVRGGPSFTTARQNLADWDAEGLEGRFEDWKSDERFELVFAATAWHWIDPTLSYRNAWLALRPGGHLAFWSASHVFPKAGVSMAPTATCNS